MTSIRMGSRAGVLLLALAGIVSLAPESTNAQQEAVAIRRITVHVAPAYPALAHSLALQGIVKVSAVVAADGSVKSVDVKGGHPVLAQAAASAVRQWKWEVAARESHEQVEVKFSPE
jgi:TonB family protein